MREKITIAGGGPGGYIAALRAAQLGAEVTLIERENIGGTCLNWGCIPSKIMKHTAESAVMMKNAGSLGIEIEGKVLVNLKAVYNRMDNVVKNQRDGIMKLLSRQRVKYINGFATIPEPNLCMVRLPDGESLEVPWEKLILAVGSCSSDLPSISSDHDKILSSNDFFSLDEIPGSIMIIGGGVIGCEFAFILKSLGSDVTIIEALPRLLPLPSVDEDCAKVLQREMKKRKIDFLLNRTVEGIEEKDGKILVKIIQSAADADLKQKNQGMQELKVEKVMLCTGRKPNTSGIGLKNIRVGTDASGWITVNERMETNVAGIYAIGDVLGPSKIMLAHVASAEGLIAAENALGQTLKMDYTVVPNAVFTMPEIANVGLTEAQALGKGYTVRSDRVLFRNIGKSHVIGEIDGEAKIVSDIENGKILGIHLVGPHATDLIAEGSLALKMGCHVKDLAETIHAHPTLSEIIPETARVALERPLHG
jgi:dihydrolipoamide dehydrogenase